MEVSNERLDQEYQRIEDDIDVMRKGHREVQQLKEEERQIQSKLRRQQEELLGMYRNSDSFRLFTSLSEEINAEGKNIIQDLENREFEIKKTIKQYEDKLEKNREKYCKNNLQK